MQRRPFCHALALLPTVPLVTLAQGSWPTRPVRLVVAFPAGGLADVMARVLQPALQEVLGQPVLIENRGGANGNVAADAVVKGGGDGHTFLVSSTGIESVNPFMFERMAFDPARDLQHVALLANSYLFLVTRPNFPAQTVEEFVAYARTQPGRLSYGSAGSGSTPHLAGELFKQDAGFFATHIPYRGAAPALQDTMGGQVDYCFAPGIAFQAARAGRLKLLAVASRQRAPIWPSAPTLAERGYGNVLADTLFGVYAPTAMSAEAVSRLNREINKLLVLPGTKTRFAELGADAMAITPVEFKSLVQAEAKLFSAVVKARRIQPD